MQYVRWQQSNRGNSTSRSRDVILTYWKGVVSITLACTLGILIWSLLQPKVYTATATGVVTIEGARDIGDALNGVDLAEAKAASYESFGKSELVSQAVIDDLDLEIHHAVLSDQMTIFRPEDTAEVHITAEGGTPQDAVILADAWLVALAARIGMLENATEDASNAPYKVNLQPLTDASERFTPESPQIGANVLLGLLVGLIIGLAYAFARHRMENLD